MGAACRNNDGIERIRAKIDETSEVEMAVGVVEVVALRLDGWGIVQDDGWITFGSQQSTGYRKGLEPMEDG